MNRNVNERNSNDTPQYFMSHINPVAFENLDERELSVISVDDDSKPKKKRNVRIVYCGDGVIEECSEDEEERRQQEAEEKKRQIELQKQMDEEAKHLTWIPWLAYMTKRNAVRTFEAADYAGEKLAWWLGITKPKFLYEIEEYKRMKQEEEEARNEDQADEIVLGEDGKITKLDKTENSTKSTTKEMVKSVLDVSDIIENKSVSSSKKSFSEAEERVKNADRLAKSLKSYFPNSPMSSKKRGPPRDARICQLNAAYKYIVHLESNLKSICSRSNQDLPEDCSLVHNTNIQANNISYRRRLENSDMTPQTPSQQRNHLVHESSTLSGATSASSPSTNVLQNPEKANTSTANSRRALKTLRKFDNIDASPIMGNENHFINENYFLNEMENFVYDINTTSKNGQTSCPKSPQKRKLVESIDENNNDAHMVDLNSEKENFLPIKATPTSSKRSLHNTPKNMSLPNQIAANYHTPENFQQNLTEQTESGRKTYFLRSTTKLKNMLIANNPVSKSTPPPSKRTPRNTAAKKNLPSRFLDTSISSTRSTSVTTTPSVPNSNMSTNSSNEFEGLDPKNLLKIDLSHEQVAQIYESNQREAI